MAQSERKGTLFQINISHRRNIMINYISVISEILHVNILKSTVSMGLLSTYNIHVCFG